MAHVASAGEGDDREIPVIDMGRKPEKGSRERGGERGSRFSREEGSGRPQSRPAYGARTGERPQRRRPAGDGSFVRLFMGLAGRFMSARDLVGAITGESESSRASLGAIEIADNFSLVEVEESLASDVIEAMRNASIRGKRVTIRRDRSHE